MLLLPDGLKRVTPVLGPWVPTRLRPEFGMIRGNTAASSIRQQQQQQQRSSSSIAGAGAVR